MLGYCVRRKLYIRFVSAVFCMRVYLIIIIITITNNNNNSNNNMFVLLDNQIFMIAIFIGLPINISFGFDYCTHDKSKNKNL